MSAHRQTGDKVKAPKVKPLKLERLPVNQLVRIRTTNTHLPRPFNLIKILVPGFQPEVDLLLENGQRIEPWGRVKLVGSQHWDSFGCGRNMKAAEYGHLIPGLKPVIISHGNRRSLWGDPIMVAECIDSREALVPG